MLTPIVYLACAFVWGTTWFAIRRCIGPGGYPTIAAAALRFALAAGILAAIWALGFARPGPRTAGQWRSLLLCGVLGAVSYALVYAAEESISGGLAAVIFGTFPLCTAILATLGRVERVTRASLAGSLVALLGIGLVFADRLEVSRAQAIGIVLMLGSVFSSALYSTILKRAAEQVHPLATTAVFLGTAGLFLGLYAMTVERAHIPWPPPARPTLALFYLALVGSVLVFAAYFFLLKRVRLMTISMLTLIEPIIALSVDAFWEKEVVLDLKSYVGIGATIVGVGVSILLGRPAPPGESLSSDAVSRREANPARRSRAG